jgi:hypothetical protein
MTKENKISGSKKNGTRVERSKNLKTPRKKTDEVRLPLIDGLMHSVGGVTATLKGCE